MAVASTHISPGVFTRIVDLSEFVRAVPSTVGYIPFLAEKGRDNELIMTNSADFVAEFGKPNINYLELGYRYNQGKYIAQEFLKESDSLYVVRVLPDNAAYAHINIYKNGSDQAALNYGSGLTTVSLFESPIDNVTWLVGFRGIGRGLYYNDIRIKITQHANTELSTLGKYSLDVYQLQTTTNTTTFLTAINDSTSGSVGDTYSVVETFVVSFNPDSLADDGTSDFVEDVINNFSNLIRCYTDRVELKSTLNAGTHYSEINFALPFPNAPATLLGGSNGASLDDLLVANRRIAAQSALIAGYASGSGVINPNTGVSLNDTLWDSDANLFSLVFDAGYTDAVKTAAVLLSKTRRDCVTIVDNHDNTNYDAAILPSAEGETGYNADYNTMYAARYEGFNKIFDSNTSKDLWVSPLYHVARAIPFNDNVGEIWFAAAGFNRGVVSGIKELRFSPRLAQRDEFYLKQINPIVNFSADGHVIFGQLTTQRKPSALQDLNVVRMILYIQKALERFAKFYIFEQNDETTWSGISKEVNGFLKEIQNQRGLYGFSVEVGATDYEKKIKRLHINISLQPIKVVEQIVMTFFVE